MRRYMLLAAALGILCTAPALAQQSDPKIDVGDYAPSIEAKEWINVAGEDEVPSLTELRGLVVCVFFWVSWHDGGESFLPYVNILQNSGSAWGPGGIYVIGVTDASRANTEPLIRSAMVQFPVAVESDSAANDYDIPSGFGFVVIDPEGKVAFRGDGAGDLNGMMSAVNKLQTENPPWRTHPHEAKQIYRLIDRSREAILRNDYEPATENVKEVVQRAVLGDRIMSEAFELVDLMDLLGYDYMAAYPPALDNKRYDEVVRVLRHVQYQFGGLDCAYDAKQELEKLVKEDEDIKVAAEKYHNEDEAARLLLDARDLLKNHRYLDSFALLRQLSTEYSSTEAAEYAEAMLNRMRANPRMANILRDRQAETECRSALARARSLIKLRRFSEAERILRRIMDEHPNTSWADQAKQELIDMPRR